MNLKALTLGTILTIGGLAVATPAQADDWKRATCQYNHLPSDTCYVKFDFDGQAMPPSITFQGNGGYLTFNNVGGTMYRGPQGERNMLVDYGSGTKLISESGDVLDFWF